MSFTTDFNALKTAIEAYATLVKNKFTTVVFATQIGAANGVAPLDATSKIPATYLPSYVDDVLEFANFASFPATGEAGKIYIDLTLDPVTNTNPQYRWTGSAYFRINNSVGTADVANKLAAARSISMSGDGTWTVSFDGSGNVTAVMTLANTVTAGTATKVTYDAKGRITNGTTLAATDIPALDWSKITTGKPTTISGYGITDALTLGNTAGAAPGTASAGSDTTAAKSDHVHPLQTTVSGNAGTATKLAAARSIGMTGDGTWSVSFDGNGNVTAAMTLANTGIVAGTYPKVTINSKGLATGGSALVAADIPSLDWSKITSGKPTTLSGYGITMTASNVTSALGFTPVQQGGGASQGTNKVYIGWMTSQLGLQVDSTNFGATWPINVSGSAATANAVNSSNNYQMNSLGVNTAPSGTAGEIRATGNIQGYYSDERLKDVLGPIENALDKICSLTGFIYVNNEIAKKYGYTSEAEQVGVGAGAVKKILPQIVLPAPFDIAQREDGSEYSKTGENYMTVMYDKLIPLVIEAIKELRQEVESLKTQKY